MKKIDRYSVSRQFSYSKWIWNFRGVQGGNSEGRRGGDHHKPSGMEISRGWGVKMKKLPWGVWIFSGTAHLQVEVIQ